MKKSFSRQLFICTFVVPSMLVLLVSLMTVGALSASNERFFSHVQGVGGRESRVSNVQTVADRRVIAIRDVALSSTNQERETAKAAALSANEELHTVLKTLKAEINSDNDIREQERLLLARIEKVEAQYEPPERFITALPSSSNASSTCDKIHDICLPMMADLMAGLREYARASREDSRIDMEASTASYSSHRTLLLALSCLAVLVTVVSGLFIIRRISGVLDTDAAEGRIAVRGVVQGELRKVASATHVIPENLLDSTVRMQVPLRRKSAEVSTFADRHAAPNSRFFQGASDLIKCAPFKTLPLDKANPSKKDSTSSSSKTPGMRSGASSSSMTMARWQFTFLRHCFKWLRRSESSTISVRRFDSRNT